MQKKTIIIALVIICSAIIGAGLGVLIWWLVTRNPYSVIELEGVGIGSLPYSAAFTRIRGIGDVFWWFYSTVATLPVTRPLIIWLDGVTGIPPSLLANLGMIGPYDQNFNRRTDSWINQCNLLFIDAPIGTGFSIPSNNNKIPTSVDENVDHLVMVLQSFYSVHENYRASPVYVFGQGDGAKSAVALAIKLDELKQTQSEDINIEGVVLGNGIISPALTMTKLGFYLEELGYIEAKGRSAMEIFSQNTNTLVNSGNLGIAFDNFISLGTFINENAGAVAVNIGHIVEKLTRNSTESRGIYGNSSRSTIYGCISNRLPKGGDYFGQSSYIRNILGSNSVNLMNQDVARALGISNANYDANRDTTVTAMRSSFMSPFTDRVEYILQSTNLSVSIYNGNLDAVSNTPGQLEWVDNLQWNGQTEFKNSPRQTLVVNRLVEGYFRESPRLKFYWINAAGLSAPLDNPAALNRILPRIIGTEV